MDSLPGDPPVAKKPKYRTQSVMPLAVIRARATRAVQEGRYQQALELGKQVYKYDSTPQNRDLLRRIYLGRAEQLRKQGYTRDACTLLENAAQLSDDDPAWLEKVATELASCGDPRRALELFRRIPGTEAQARVHALTADSALQQGPAGRNLLPESLRSQYDLIVQAFRQLEAGQDELVKETLQGIGLQSPFLEWKLLLRGLQAYYLKEDLRALENWQRLNPDRLPAKLAAPLRFQIDPAFRQAQPPETQAILQKQGDRLQDSGFVQPMRHLQKILADPEQLPSAFRLAEGMVAGLRQQAPHLVPRLAACFYWAIIDHGQPEDMTRYRRVFGNPPDDPEMFRLQALVNEHIFEMQ